MRIIIASGIFFPELGGPATYAVGIAEAFVKLGHDVTVLSYSDCAEHEKDTTYTFSVIRVTRGGKIGNYIRYFKALWRASKDADVIYAFDHMSAGIPAAFVSSIRRIRLYIRIGGDFIWERYLRNTGEALAMRDYYEKGLHTADRRFGIIKWVFKKAYRLVFTTKFQAGIFEKYYGFSHDKICFIQNPLPELAHVPVRENVNKEILFAGRVINKNNVRRCIEAFSAIVQDTYTLVVIGEGEIKEELISLVQEKGIQRVRFEPKMPREKLIVRIVTSYAMVFPSLTDISPNGILDCLLVQTPFISSEEIGYDWLLDDIMHFDPRSTEDMKKAFENIMDEDEYHKYTDKIQQISYHYTFDGAARDTLKLFERT